MKKLFSIISLALVFSVILVNSSFAYAGPVDEMTTSPAEKLTPALTEQYELSNENDAVPAMIWLTDVDLSQAETEALAVIGVTEDEIESLGVISSVDYTPVDVSREEDGIDLVQTYIEAKRNAVTELYTEHNQRLVDELLNGIEVAYISRYSPVIIADLTSNEAVELSYSIDVQEIDYLDTSIVELAPVADSSAQIALSAANSITRASNVHTSSTYGFSGSGVKIGVLEIAIPTADAFSDATVVWDPNDSRASAYAWHANNVMDILTSIAPDADYYVAGTYSTADDYAAIEALLDAGVNIISASRTVGSDGNNNYGTAAKWLDHIAYQHDVHFVKSCGNLGGGYQIGGSTGANSGAMAYNIITVGNLYVNGTTDYSDDVIWTGSGPSSYYTGSTLAYKPDICAPGEGVVTSFDKFGGTSGATPNVAGAIALLCEQRSALKTQQSTVKAILTASVNFTSPHRYTPADANYRLYGSGLLDCIGACFVTGNYRYATSSFPSGSSSKTHTFSVTSSDSRIRVSLAFNMKSVGSGDYDTTITTGNVYNLNIQVKDPNGTIVASSATTKNNVEVVDFVPEMTGTYSVVVTRADSYTDTVYYGLAWR